MEVGSGEQFLGGARSAAVSGRCETEVSTFGAAREALIDTIADALERHLDRDRVLGLVEHGAPRGLPVVRGGLVR